MLAEFANLGFLSVMQDRGAIFVLGIFVGIILPHVLKFLSRVALKRFRFSERDFRSAGAGRQTRRRIRADEKRRFRKRRTRH